MRRNQMIIISDYDASDDVGISYWDPTLDGVRNQQPVVGFAEFAEPRGELHRMVAPLRGMAAGVYKEVHFNIPRASAYILFPRTSRFKIVTPKGDTNGSMAITGLTPAMLAALRSCDGNK